MFRLLDTPLCVRCSWSQVSSSKAMNDHPRSFRPQPHPYPRPCGRNHYSPSAKLLPLKCPLRHSSSILIPYFSNTNTSPHTTQFRSTIKWPGGVYKLLNQRALKISPANKINIFQCIDKAFWVEFQRVPLKFHTKYITHTSKDAFLYNIAILIALRFKSS